jgi:iron(III) transport system ATP-binding protein
MLTVENIALFYGHKNVLKEVSFKLQKGDIGCLLGASGCGKTTLLRIIAGFEQLKSGRVMLKDNVLSDPSIHIKPELRHVGLMFQDYALFPHLSVQENIAFGLDALSAQERKNRVEEMLELVGLSLEANAKPHRLSGGQQQRVALARALAPKPSLLLLDEPFSNLDPELREKLSLEVREIIKHEGVSSLLVTHDQHEAFAMADVVGVMHEGVIEQWDTPYNLYHQPINRYVADFIGQGVFLPGVVRAGNVIEIELGALKNCSNTIATDKDFFTMNSGRMVDVLIRPDDIIHDDQSTLLAEVERKVFHGADFIYTFGYNIFLYKFGSFPSTGNLFSSNTLYFGFPVNI